MTLLFHPASEKFWLADHIKHLNIIGYPPNKISAGRGLGEFWYKKKSPTFAEDFSPNQTKSIRILLRTIHP